MRVAAGIIISVGQGGQQILAAKKGYGNRQLYDGFGGKIEAYDETIGMAALRELLEELFGIKLYTKRGQLTTQGARLVPRLMLEIQPHIIPLYVFKNAATIYMIFHLTERHFFKLLFLLKREPMKYYRTAPQTLFELKQGRRSAGAEISSVHVVNTCSLKASNTEEWFLNDIKQYREKVVAACNLSRPPGL